MNTLKQQLKRVKELQGIVNPDASWVIQNKSKLMSQISQVDVHVSTALKNIQTLPLQTKVQSMFVGMQTMCKVFTPQRYARSLRPVFTMALALLVTASGWVASAYAEPGDPLWTAKAAWNSMVERSQLAVTATEDEAPLHLKFAAKQAQVLKQVVGQEHIKPKIKEELIKQTSLELEKKLAVADESLKKASVETVADFVKEVSLKTKEISDVVKESVQKVAEENAKVSGTVSVAVVEGLDKAAIDVQKKSLDMVETVVQKKTEGNLEISEEEKTIIKQHIDGVVEDIKEAAQKAKTNADQLQAVVHTDVVNSSTSTASSTTSSVEMATVSSTDSAVSTTISISTKSISTKEAIDIVVKKVDETALTISAQASVSEKITSGNVLEAIQEIKQLNNTVSQTVEQVAKVGKEILPDIQNGGRVIDTSVASSTTTSIVVPSVPAVSTTTN